MAKLETAQIMVNVEPKSGARVGTWGGSANVNEDGRFEFTNVPAGEYRFTSQPNPGNPDKKYVPEQIFKVESGATTTLKVEYP